MKKNKGLLGLWILGLALVLALAAWFLLFRFNRFSMEMTLAGEPKATLEYGEHYQEPGVTALVRGSRFFQKGFVPGDIRYDTRSDLVEDKLGCYKITYCASSLFASGEVTRRVQVVDTRPPVITLTPDDPEALTEDAPYTEAGFQAWDNYDGDITDKVIRQETPELVTYAVVDSSGNPAKAERKIPYWDSVPPEITLSGGENYRIYLGRPYSEPGFSALDNDDGDLTAQVTVSGEVDWRNLGVYPITYTVSDSRGNETQVIRSVEVAAHQPPDTVYPEGKVIYLTFDDGPSAYTPRLLDVLDKYNAKATFFVIGTKDGETMREIVRRGHSIGSHSITHNYAQVYADPDAYFDDLWATQKAIYDNTGVQSWLMRFPGGSSNEVSRRTCVGIMTYLTGAVQAAGFQYFDWNVYSGDAGSTTDTAQVAQNVIQGIQEQPVSLVLQHDIHRYSVDAVETILKFGTQNGYRFLALDMSSPAFHHDLNN